MNELKDFFKCFYPHDSSIEDWFTMPNPNQDELGGGIWFSCIKACKVGSMLVEKNDFILIDRQNGKIVAVLKSIGENEKIQILDAE